MEKSNIIIGMPDQDWQLLERRCAAALEARAADPAGLRRPLESATEPQALRLFNGFYEGCPELVVDLYGRTLALYGYADEVETSRALLDWAQAFWTNRLAGVSCVVQKIRTAEAASLRRGRLTLGEAPETQIREHGVWYALDLTMNQDASFYLDTRLLRRWLIERGRGWRVLNTFAYTGSLGVAALAGGASRVIQVDRSRKFLGLARRSAMLNRLDLGRMKLRAADFFSQVGELKRRGERQNEATEFDCAILDPPFFSRTGKGTVDQVGEGLRLINKLRPLVVDGGYLVAINNALFLSGAEYLAGLERLCADGYLALETLIPVPPDLTGYPETRLSAPPVDPAPFNHPTKIAVLRVKKK